MTYANTIFNYFIDSSRRQYLRSNHYPKTHTKGLIVMDKNPFEGLISFQDAADLYGKNDSTLRRAVMDGRLVEGTDCKKFGKQWIVTLEAMKRLYGEPPQKNE